MTQLSTYIKNENNMRSIFKMDLLRRPTNAAECKPLFGHLEGELSPENLHCDGEITAAAARKKYKHFTAVWKELENIQGAKQECMSADIN